MSASKAQLVNQQLQHSRVLLSLLDEACAQEASADEGQFAALKAKQQALLNAVVSALHLAAFGFLDELAESLQLSLDTLSLDELGSKLGAQNRTHAIYENYRTLEQKPQSWLSELMGAKAAIFYQTPSFRKVTAQNERLIAASGGNNMTAEKAYGILDALDAFVGEQRAFLSEW